MGDDDDVVRVFIDGELEIRGGSWENYYRFTEQRNPSASDRLLFRTAGTAAPVTKGKGFLFDDVMSKSYHVDNPAPLHPVVLPGGSEGRPGPGRHQRQQRHQRCRWQGWRRWHRRFQRS